MLAKMSKFANVIYAYSPKNDDELELIVGDRIEVIGFEEEGWWRGKLRGRIGVFPSNFVQVIETSSPSTLTTSQTASKLNSIFGSKVTSKNSISSNSLNSINNNMNNMNNNNSSSSNNLIMNNTQPNEANNFTNEYPITPADESAQSANSSSERRPKPIRGVGYGDIFAAGAKAKTSSVDTTKPTAMASERLSQITSNLASTLQKPIPKKPPPPAPTNDINSNGSSSVDQPPALPPKPSNQPNPFLQQHSRLIQPAQREIREQARVVYAYKSSNPDELTIEVGDIINVIDKEIEDAGWWKGELNGKVGVFPDNFVELIRNPADAANSDATWQHNSSRGSLTGATIPGFNQQQQQPQPPINAEGKIKSVFNTTPKGFSEKLENNLEKQHNNQAASFLSIKKNKLQQQISTGSAIASGEGSVLPSNDSVSIRSNETSDNMGPLETNSAKLNHITANRAKGPSRRPPSNIMSKRAQSVDVVMKRETNGRNDFTLGSLPTNNHSQSQQETPSTFPVAHATTPIVASFQSNSNEPIINNAVAPKPGLPAENIVDNQTVTPKTSQRLGNPPVIGQSDKVNSTPTTGEPSWMAKLRQSNLEKKRDMSTVIGQDETVTTTNNNKVAESTTPLVTNETPTAPSSPEKRNSLVQPSTDATSNSTSPSVIERSPIIQRSPQANLNKLNSNKHPSNGEDEDRIMMTKVQYDNLFKQISKSVSSEIGELREEFGRLREEFKGISELKATMDAMKIELKACQSATENQKRYIKELVNNLADERKKIAAMQGEIERNLK